DLSAAIKAIESEVAELALVVAENVVERELRTDPSLVVSVVRAALAEAADLPVTRIRAHPEDIAILQEAIEAIVPPSLDPKIPLMADPHLERGGCLIETTAGLVDAQPRTKLAEIGQCVLATLNG